ncbi:MAG: NTP transferase domain-containing protein [Aquabacterium sp.]
MNRLPTLLVLAHASAANQRGKTLDMPSPEEQALRLFDTLHDTLRKGLESGLPVLLVAPRDVAERARTLLPGNCVVELEDNEPTFVKTSEQPDNFARAVAAGVLASAHADGWLILPARVPMLRANTLRRIADAPDHQPVVVPQYQQMSGHPIRFSSEFFSELIRLQSERDLNRLIARYPTVCMDVDDPGVLITSHAHIGFVQSQVGQRAGDAKY